MATSNAHVDSNLPVVNAPFMLEKGLAEELRKILKKCRGELVRMGSGNVWTEPTHDELQNDIDDEVSRMHRYLWIMIPLLQVILLLFRNLC